MYLITYISWSLATANQKSIHGSNIMWYFKISSLHSRNARRGGGGGFPAVNCQKCLLREKLELIVCYIIWTTPLGNYGNALGNYTAVLLMVADDVQCLPLACFDIDDTVGCVVVRQVMYLPVLRWTCILSCRCFVLCGARWCLLFISKHIYLSSTRYVRNREFVWRNDGLHWRVGNRSFNICTRRRSDWIELIIVIWGWPLLNTEPSFMLNFQQRSRSFQNISQQVESSVDRESPHSQAICDG